MEPYEAETDDLAEQLVELKRQLDGLRPLTSEAMALLWPKFENDSVYYTYATNAIEGGTLTQGETASFLEYGITVGGKSFTDHLDATNGHKAFMQMLQMVKERTPISEEIVMRLFRVAAAADAQNAGFHRNDQRYITGSNHVPPVWHKVPAKLHYGIGNIHPFSDYNGRTARLVMNLSLMQQGYVPITIDLQERARYLEALEKSRFAGEALLGDPGRSRPRSFCISQKWRIG